VGAQYPHRLRVTVQLLESLGSEIVAHFDVGLARLASADPDVASEVSTDVATVGRLDPRSQVKVGDVVDVAVNTENLHFFDPVTQLAI